MFEHYRNDSGGTLPISRHPLFPAIVALWFGALFGLGSIAIRPTVIEGLVQTLGIDVLIPMAAPPLGTTTRILIALAMTGIGGVIGATIARRIARHGDGEAGGRRRRLGPTTFSPAPAVSTPPEAPVARRRGLTSRIAGIGADLAERVPLPGREAKIFDVAEFDLEGFEEAAPAPASPAPPAAEPEAIESPLLHKRPGGFGSRLHALPPTEATPEAAGEQVDIASLAADPHQDEPGEPVVVGPVEPPVRESPPAALSNHLFEVYARKAVSQVEDAAKAEIAEPGFKLLPRLTLGDRVAQAWNEPIEPAGTFADEPQPLSFIEASPPPPPEGPAMDISVEHADTGDGLEPASAAHEPEQVEEIAAAVEPERPVDERSAAERIVAAELDELSPLELVERLALAMAQRRDQAKLEAELAAARRREEAAAALRVAAPVLPAAEAQPETAETASADPEPLPVAEAEQPPYVPAALPRIPSTLRPVGSGAGFDDEDDALPGYVPPRHIGLTPVAPAARMDAAADGDDADDEDPALAEGYSSLLNLSRPIAGGQPFARTEENEGEVSDGDAPPSVAFPAQPDAVAPFARPVRGATATEADQEPATRPFDAPAAHDPEETERALRAALATLQRMSGAA